MKGWPEFETPFRGGQPGQTQTIKNRGASIMRAIAYLSLLALLFVATTDARADVPVRSSPIVPVSLADPITQDLLWDQFDGTVTNAYTAQNFEAGLEAYDNEMADDFTVPAGFEWLLEELVFYGIYYNCGTTGLPPCGPTDSWDVTIYANTGGMPGAVVAGPYNIVATQVLDTLNQYFFVLTFPAGVVVTEGSYWVGATANMSFSAAGQIGIGDNDILHGSMAMWQNPGDGFLTGCSSWGVAQTCFGAAPPGMTDYSWQLYGDSQITCDDIRTFQARCNPAGSIQARLTMTDNSHGGEMVVFSIDGDPYPATISGAGGTVAQLNVPGIGAGPHTVDLADPAGCTTPVEVRCRVSSDQADLGWDDEDNLVAQPEVQGETRLLGNHPNPFNPSTSISYSLAKDGFVSLKIYNTLGQEVATLVNEYQVAGTQTSVWNGRNEYGATVASGIYIYRLTTDNVVLSEKMLFMK
jgi:hypothetical protein